MMTTALPVAALALLLAAPDAPSQIVGASLTSSKAYERLQYLCDYIGPRLSGSAALDEALLWAEKEMKADGLSNVHREKVMVPVWVRGQESATLVLPRKRSLTILGLGGSVGTKRKGITADVVAVDSFEALKKLGDGARGKIVLVNRPMPADIEAFAAYDQVYQYRSESASKAAGQGAVAVLIRSLTTRSLQTPHTGSLRYDKKVPQIPAASVTTEDADLLQRFLDRGERVQVRLQMGAKTKPDAPSANVIAEVRGTEKPEEIVLIGAHIDSWDVGTGAHDDGAGVILAMEAARILKTLELAPRRTIRVVLWTNEENGLRGAFAYWEKHKHEKHIAGIESDSGASRPIGFTVEGSAETLQALRKLTPPLQSLDAARIRKGFSGVDLIPLVAAGVPGIGLEPDSTHYFDIHHTAADTFDKIDPLELNLQVAAFTLMAYQVANAPDPLPPGPKAKGTH